MLLAFGFSGAQADTCSVNADQPEIAFHGHPFAVAATTDDCWLFVSLSNGRDSGAISVLRNENGVFSPLHELALHKGAYGLALSHDESTLYVAQWSGIAVLDVRKMQSNDPSALLGNFATGNDASTLYTMLSLDGRLLFSSNENSKSLSVFDLTKVDGGAHEIGTLVGRVPTAKAPVGMANSPDGHWLYATSEVGPLLSTKQPKCAAEQHSARDHAPGVLLRIDVEKAATDPAHALNSEVAAGCNPVRVAVSPSGTRIWVSARGDNALLWFDMAGSSATTMPTAYGKINIGPSPVGVAVRADGSQVWVALSDRFGQGKGGLAGVLDASAVDAPKKLAQVSASGFPREVAFLADGRTLVATLFDAERIRFLQTP